MHLGAVEGSAGDDPARLDGEPEDVAGEAEAEFGGDRRGVPHAVHGEAEDDDLGLPLTDEGFEGILVDVVLELVPAGADGDDLVDSLEVDEVGESCRVGGDDGDAHGAGQLLGSGHELAGDVAQAPVEVLGDDERAAHDSRPFTSSAMRTATATASSPSSSAPAPRSGTYILRNTVGARPAGREADDLDLLLSPV